MPAVVLPVLNEIEAIPAVLAAMPAGFEPIVVDNGSDDGSADLAKRLGALVVDEPQKGFGAACLAGLEAASSEVVCFMDCDETLDPGELSKVADPVAEGAADLVLGARRAVPGAWPLHARVANRVLVSQVRRRTGLRLKDIGPMRAARREELLALGLRDRRFGWPLEMVIRAAEAGWRVDEVPVAYLPRRGESKVTGTIGGTVRAIADMSRVLRLSDEGESL